MLQKSSIWKTLEIFCQFPTKEHYLMDISRNINVAHTSVKRNLRALVKQGIVTTSTRKQGRRNFPIFKANVNNPTFKKYKQLYNLMALMESGLIEFIEKQRMPNAIVLFGSYARGEDVEESDIDLFVECKERPLDVHKFEIALHRKVQLHMKESFISYPLELKNNIINGIVLHGYLEGYK